MTSRPIAVDVFSGAGGMSLGIEQAGFDVVAAVEFDPIHAAIHALNFPLSKVLCSDVRAQSGDDIREAVGLGEDDEIDLVFGGPPCQGFSLIGYRVLDDPRNDLVFHFARLVQELRPRAFVFENVPGMATGGHVQLLEELIALFAEIGYETASPYLLLNAAAYGVPQNRRRLVLIGTREDVPDAKYPPEITSVRNGKTPNGHRPYGPSVRDAIGDLPDIEDFAELETTDVLRHHIVGGSEYARRLRGVAKDPKDFSYPRRRDPDVLTGCSRARHTEESRRRFAETVPGTTEKISRFYRLDWDGISNTLRAGTARDRGGFSAPRPLHPEYARCISVREAARLHSYPDWFRFHRTIWHGFRQIGNSVAPLLARSIGTSVVDALGYRPTKPRKILELGPDELRTMTMQEAERHFGLAESHVEPRKRVAKRGA